LVISSYLSLQWIIGGVWRIEIRFSRDFGGRGATERYGGYNVISFFYRRFFGVLLGVEENYCFLPAD
jgi:hypothetical protein